MYPIIVKRAIGVAVVLTVGLIGNMALADTATPAAGLRTAPKADLTHALVKVQMNQSDFTLHKRAAVGFKAFEMKDPKTGKALAANTMVTLANGKKMTAGDYFGQLNALERKFNAIGHTLHEGAGQKVVLQEAIIPHAELQKQTKALSAAHARFDAKTMLAAPKLATLQQSLAAAPKLNAARLARIGEIKLNPGAGPAQTTHNLRTWNYTVGKQSLIAAYLSGKLETTGAKDSVQVNGEASAGGYLMNHQMALLEAKGSVQGRQTGAGRATLNIRVMGQTIYNLDQSSPSWSLSKSLSKSFDYGTSIHFSIGPIPISGRLGARGSAGVRFALGMQPAHATAQIVPNVTAKVYAQVGVDIGVASAGVGGELTLLTDELTFGGEIGVDADRVRGPYISEHFYAQNHLEMLAGRFYLFARVNYLIGSKEWDLTLWNWSGFHADGYLFNVNNRTYLYSPQAVQGGVAQQQRSQ